MKNNKASKYTEDWVPIKQIMNGMIQLDSNESLFWIKTLKIKPFII